MAVRDFEFDLRALRQLLAVAESGSMTRAAHRAGVAQPALSQQIRRVENALGRALFDRHARGVRLTAAGEEFVLHARKILGAVALAHTELFGAPGEIGGSVVVGLPISAAELFGMDFIERIRTRHPALRLVMHDRSSTAVNGLLLSGELDLALTFYRPLEKSVEATALYEERLALVIPATFHAAGRPRVIDIARLGEVPLALLARPYGLRQILDDAARAARVKLNVLYEFESIHLLREAVVRGLACSVLPPGLVAPHLRRGRLYAAKLSGESFRRTLYLAQLTSRPASRSVGTARELLVGCSERAISAAPLSRFYRQA